MNFDAIRNDFPIVQNWVYMNHAAVAPLSLTAAEAICSLTQDVAEHSMAHFEDWNALVRKARQSVGGFIGARPEEIAFLKNTSDGIIAVAEGIDWRPGDNVVVASCEFPANVYPWLNLESKGVEIHWVKESQGRLRPEDYESAMDNRTRVLTASAVQFHSGFHSNLGALAELCWRFGSLFVVDGIQSVGALPIDVHAMGIDFLAADGHKWMMGPEGCALLYCSENAMNAVGVAALGWANVSSDRDFFSYDRTMHNDARRFETGTLNTIGIAGLKAAIDLLSRHDMQLVSNRILHLTDILCENLPRLGFRLYTPRGRNEKSGIVTFTREGLDMAHIEKHLLERRIIATVRHGSVRLSPHFYNSEGEIEEVLAALSS